MMKNASPSIDRSTSISTATDAFTCAHCGATITPRTKFVRKSYNGQEWLLCLPCHKGFKDLCNEIAGNAASFYLVRSARKSFRRLAAS